MKRIRIAGGKPLEVEPSDFVRLGLPKPAFFLMPTEEDFQRQRVPIDWVSGITPTLGNAVTLRRGVYEQPVLDFTGSANAWMDFGVHRVIPAGARHILFAADVQLGETASTNISLISQYQTDVTLERQWRFYIGNAAKNVRMEFLSAANAPQIIGTTLVTANNITPGVPVVLSGGLSSPEGVTAQYRTLANGHTGYTSNLFSGIQTNLPDSLVPLLIGARWESPGVRGAFLTGQLNWLGVWVFDGNLPAGDAQRLTQRGWLMQQLGRREPQFMARQVPVNHYVNEARFLQYPEWQPNTRYSQFAKVRHPTEDEILECEYPGVSGEEAPTVVGDNMYSTEYRAQRLQAMFEGALRWRVRTGTTLQMPYRYASDIGPKVAGGDTVWLRIGNPLGSISKYRRFTNLRGCYGRRIRFRWMDAEGDPVDTYTGDPITGHLASFALVDMRAYVADFRVDTGYSTFSLSKSDVLLERINMGGVNISSGANVTLIDCELGHGSPSYYGLLGGMLSLSAFGGALDSRNTLLYSTLRVSAKLVGTRMGFLGDLAFLSIPSSCDLEMIGCTHKADINSPTSAFNNPDFAVVKTDSLAVLASESWLGPVINKVTGSNYREGGAVYRGLPYSIEVVSEITSERYATTRLQMVGGTRIAFWNPVAGNVTATLHFLLTIQSAGDLSLFERGLTIESQYMNVAQTGYNVGMRTSDINVTSALLTEAPVDDWALDYTPSLRRAYTADISLPDAGVGWVVLHVALQPYSTWDHRLFMCPSPEVVVA